MNKGLNLQSLKNENRSSILYLLNRHSLLSRKELSNLLGLTPAAVTKICFELISQGLVKELDESGETGKSGRREKPLTLDLKSKNALCVNVERDAVTFALSTLDGQLISMEQIPFMSDAKSVAKKSREFLDALDDKGDVVGAGVCIIGSDDENDFGVWKGSNIKEIFENELSLDVTLENNVKAFAEAELIYGAKEKNNSVLFLKWGPGIGSAIIADGKVFSGGDSSVAEIGHYIVDPGGAPCRCGRYGCLETVASENAILSEINTQQTLDEVLKNCDNTIMNIIEHKIDLVALALTNTATILNAESIVLFGKMFTNEIIALKLRKQCLRYNSNLTEDMIKLSSLNEKSCYIGAAAICAKAFFFERAN